MEVVGEAVEVDVVEVVVEPVDVCAVVVDAAEWMTHTPLVQMLPGQHRPLFSYTMFLNYSNT